MATAGASTIALGETQKAKQKTPGKAKDQELRSNKSGDKNMCLVDILESRMKQDSCVSASCLLS